MSAAARFLIVDDDDLVRSSLATLLGRYGSITAASSATEAGVCIESTAEFDGLMIDIRLGDGSGLDVLAQARRRNATTPAVIFSATLERKAINRASALGARFVCKPCGTRELAPFITDVLLRTSRNRIFAITEGARHRWSLSPREAEVLGATLRGRTRDDIILETGMSLTTVKTHVRRILEKTDYPTLSSLAIDLLQD